MCDIFTSARSWLQTALQVLPYKDNHGDEEQFCDDDDDDDSDERDRGRDDDFISWWFNNTSKTDVAPWCYKWVERIGIGSPGGGMYRAPYGANNVVMLIKVMIRNSNDCNDDAKDSSVD